MQEAAVANSLAYIKQYKQKCREVLEKLPDAIIAELITVLKRTRDEDRQIFLCGNGGSAATASHFATDLGKGASLGRERRFRVLSLTDNVPWITAMANDTDYSRIFVEPLQNYARPGDLLLAFSGSGNSPNVIAAVEWANQNGLVTVGITGRPGGKLGQLAQHPIFAESSHMGFIEDAHFVIQHIVGYYFMESKAD
ncbi:MAG: SIS domain-containing protein [Acidobacteria bacterium]|nr:MAG: SIS domain-containing protein [Acidobacteriota bacterium]